MEEKPNVTVMHLPSMIRVDATNRMDVVYAEIDEALGGEGAFNANEFEENMSTNYGRMVHEDDGRSFSPIPRTRTHLLRFELMSITSD
jgi:propane monooxygenase coupling protein